MKNSFLWICLVFLLVGCSEELVRQSECTGDDRVKVYCGFNNPEDIEPLPDGRHLIISEMPTFGSAPLQDVGLISLFDLQTGQRSPFVPEAGLYNWGDPSCELPDLARLQPHGIFLDKYSDGTLRLLAVNHFELVDRLEMFEVRPQGEGWQLFWRGALCMPDNSYINDVTSLPDGRIFFTRMFDKAFLTDPSANFQTWVRALLGASTGWVWQWHRDTGYSVIPGSEGSLPNGIVAVPELSRLFVNHYTGGSVVALDANDYRQIGRLKVASPDNTAFSGGSLWLASHDFGATELDLCAGVDASPCLLAFSIYRIDPAAIEGEVSVAEAGTKVYSRPQNTLPYGAATVAVPAAGRLWMGTFVGDRIAALKF